MINNVTNSKTIIVIVIIIIIIIIIAIITHVHSHSFSILLSLFLVILRDATQQLLPTSKQEKNVQEPNQKINITRWLRQFKPAQK